MTNYSLFYPVAIKYKHKHWPTLLNKTWLMELKSTHRWGCIFKLIYCTTYKNKTFNTACYARIINRKPSNKIKVETQTGLIPPVQSAMLCFKFNQWRPCVEKSNLFLHRKDLAPIPTGLNRTRWVSVTVRINTSCVG